MALHITSAAPATLLKLAPKVWEQKIRDYYSARSIKKAADAEARAADKTVKPLKAQLLEAMGDSPAATCGNMVLTVKRTAASDAAITLTDGSKVAWSTVTSVLCGNRTIAAGDVASLYGGREGSTDVDVAGA